MSGRRIVAYDPIEKKIVTEEEDASGITHRVTITYEPAAYYGVNQALHTESYGQRWGGGQLVASMPMHVYFDSDLFRAQKDGDDKAVKRFLNDPENRGYRTFKGRV